MGKTDVDAAFAELKSLGQCNSRSKFSEDWLGREKSYYRGIQSKGRPASLKAQIHLIKRLLDFGEGFVRSEFPSMCKLGKTYLRLSGELLGALLAGAR